MTSDIPASTDQPGSAYFMDHAAEAEQRATFAVVVGRRHRQAERAAPMGSEAQAA